MKKGYGKVNLARAVRISGDGGQAGRHLAKKTKGYGARQKDLAVSWSLKTDFAEHELHSHFQSPRGSQAVCFRGAAGALRCIHIFIAGFLCAT